MRIKDETVNIITAFDIDNEHINLWRMQYKKDKVLPEPYAHRAALISVSLALIQTPVYTARPRIRG